MVNYAKNIREENRKLKKELRKSYHDIPKTHPSWTAKTSQPYSSYCNEPTRKASDFQVVVSRRNSIVQENTKNKDTTNPQLETTTQNIDIEKIVQMEVDAAVGQMHVAMQRDLAKVRAKYRTKLHEERQKNKKR